MVLKEKLDLKLMKKAIKFFVGKHNFSSMRAASCVAKSAIRSGQKQHKKK